MKLFVAICLLVSATVSLAADRAIYDLQYLPNAGTNYGISNLGLASGTQETSLTDSKITGWVINQEVGHSFTDRFLLSADLTFQHIDANTDVDSPGVSDVNATTKGISDPSINGRFRVMDEALRIDVVSNLIVTYGDSKTEGSQTNNSQGGDSISLGVEAGQVTDTFQYVGTASINRVFEATDKTDGVTTKDDAHNEYLLGAAGLFKIAEASFIKGILSAEFVDDYEDNDTTDTSGDTASSTTYTVGAAYQYLVSSNLIVQAGLNASSINTAGVDSYHLYILTVGAKYQF
jgi:hypothetical protein